MKISYNPTEKDFITANEDAKYVNWSWNNMYKYIAWFVIAVLLAERSPFKLMFLNILVVAVIILIFYSVDYIYTINNYKKYFKMNSLFLGNRIYEIDSNGIIFASNNDYKITFPMKYVTKVINTKNTIIILTAFVYLYIPKRLFSNDDEVNNFIKLIKG
jgi:hypothetical protein